MDQWNWSAIATIGTLIIAFGVLWSAIDDVGDEVGDLRERMARVETLIDERLPRHQALVPEAD